jgi:competence protein ComEA
MRFPFFKSSAKVEPRGPINTPPAAGNKLAATQRIPLPSLLNPRQVKPTPSTPVTPTVTPVAVTPVSGPTVPLKVSSVSPQIPTQVYSAQGHTLAASATVNLPVKLILPQLATGKVTLKLSDLLSYFPSELLRSPLPPYPETQNVVLPLEEIIPAIPADLLHTTHDSEVSLDDPEFAKLPTLIDDETLAAQRKQRANPVALADTQPIHRPSDDPFRGIKNASPPAPAPAPAPAAAKPVEPLAIVVPPRPRNDLPESIVVSLKSLVAVLPESIFNCSRAEAELLADSKDPILLPAEPIIPQLRTGTARIPVTVIVSLMPHNILADPMPNLDGLMAPLPLAEIIPQLPQSVFTDHLREPAEEPIAADLDIPDPFQEKNAPAASAPKATETVELDSEVLADENFSIFSEKSPAPPPAAAAPEPVAPDADTVRPISLAPDEEPPALVEPEPAPVSTATAPVAPEPPPAVEPPAPLPVVVPEQMAEAQPVAPAPAPVADPAYADADLADDDETDLAPVPEPAAAAPDERKLLVDLNRCTAEDLMAIPGIGRALANRIIEFRNSRGRFTSIEELRLVPGIGRKTFRALAGVQPRALNRLLGADHDGELSLQEIVRLTGQLPGIQGCMLALSDGLFLTGQLPPHLDQNTISVFAPQLFKKVGRYARELKVGQIRRFTIFTDTQPLSIFKAADVYLIIVHDAQRYSKALLRRCERISEEIARLSSQRVTV